MKPLQCTLLLLAAVILTAGCNKLRDAAVKQKIANDLKCLCDAYGQYYSARGHGPSSVDDLDALATGDAELQGDLNAVREGKYVLIWNVDVHAAGQTNAGMSFTVLGYERKVPETGGLVLMVDGTVLEMKPEKFAKAQKGDALDKNRPG
jgi:hypothetical protein